MGIDRANRAFFALVAVALIPYLALTLVGCGFLTVVGIRVADHGLGFATAGPGDLRPALVALGVVGVGTFLAVRALLQQLAATRRLGARVESLRKPAPPALADAASRLGLDPARIDFVDAEEPFSFAFGVSRPRIAVSRGLVDSTTPEQLDAVLVHERHHVRNLDPLKVVLARVLSAAYFFLPALRGLRDRYDAASELAADRRALGATGPGPIAGALFAAVRGPAWPELATAAALGGPELLEMRVAQLEAGAESPATPVSRASVAVTLFALAGLVAGLLASITSLGGPGAVMREAMGDGDMDMDMGGWRAVVGMWPWLVGALGVGAWAVVRHTRRPVP